MSKSTTKYLPPYVVPTLPDLSLMDEPQIYPYPKGLLPTERIEWENWKLLDVYWNIDNDSHTNFSRYYFSYIGAQKKAILPDKFQFTGYALMESRWDTKVKNYADPEEMWGIYKWAYKGMLSSQNKNRLALKLLWEHWKNMKEKDKDLSWYRRFHNVYFILNRQHSKNWTYRVHRT